MDSNQISEKQNLRGTTPTDKERIATLEAEKATLQATVDALVVSTLGG